MHQQEMGKASSSRRRPSDGHPYAADRPKASVASSENLPSDMATPISAPSSYLDTSIPFNLPPRRSMKMLKDGSDFVWPDAAHALFVRGLQAWKFINIGSKRTRAPRGEGKTDFLTRYLQSHGVERTKKQVASHLQVLRTEWRNLHNPVLLSLVDETASHARSLSEPSLPPPVPTPSRSSPSSATSLPVFHPSPDSNDDRSLSTPVLPSPVPTVSPSSSSTLFHSAHNLYGTRPQLFPVTVPDDPYPTHSTTDIGSWQMENTVWNPPTDRFASHQADSFSRQPSNYPGAGYEISSGFHEHQRSARSIDTPIRESSSFGADYYVQGISSHRDLAASLSIAPHSQPCLALETVNSPTLDLASQAGIPLSPFDSYNSSPSYPILQQPTPRDNFGNANMPYGIEPYQPQFNIGGEQLQQQTTTTPPSHTLGSAGSASSYDVVEPDFLSGVSSHVQQPQWVRPPATFPRSPDNAEQHRSPEA